MGSRLLKYLLSGQTGRALLIALLIVLAAAGAKLYYDTHTTEPARVAKLTEEGRVDALVDAIEAWVGDHRDAERPFPDDTPWTPSTLECGRDAITPEVEAAHPTWKALGATFEGPGRYQLRFTATQDRFELLARTDADCDGIHEVMRRSGEVGLAGLSLDPPKLDNPGE